MKITRYGQVAELILNLINNGVLKEGEKIPSIRQLSQELNVSINTVKEAYWKLERENHIVAVPQSGFYVQKQFSDTSPKEEIDPSRLDPQEVSLCHIYGAFQNMGQCTPEVSLGIATLNPEFWPTQKMGRYYQEAMRYQEIESYNYIMSPGNLFTMKEKYSNCMRLNAGFWNEKVEKAIKHIGQLCVDQQKNTVKKSSKLRPELQNKPCLIRRRGSYSPRIWVKKGSLRII